MDIGKVRKLSMGGYLYIIKSAKSGRYYIGSTSDIERRLSEHNRGQTKSTVNHTPWNLLFCKLFTDISVAHKLERRLKKMKSRKIIEQIIADQEVKIGPVA